MFITSNASNNLNASCGIHCSNLDKKGKIGSLSQQDSVATVVISDEIPKGRRGDKN